MCNKRIGIDIDGTLTTMDIVLDIFNRETGQDLLLGNIVEYDVGKCYGLSKEESGRIWGTFTDELVERSLPIWDLEEFMGKWERYGLNGKGRNEIIIVTARPEEFRGATELWLRNNNIGYDELYLGYESKLDAVREYFLDVMVDDKGEHIQEIDESGYGECRQVKSLP